MSRRSTNEEATVADIVDFDRYRIPDWAEREPRAAPALSAYERHYLPVWRLLLQNAKHHAPKLAWRADADVKELIEREVVPDARFILAGNVADAETTNIINTFVESLWDLIRRHRRECSKITKG